MSDKHTPWWQYIAIPVGILVGGALAVLLRTSDADRVTLNRGETVSPALLELAAPAIADPASIQRTAVVFGYRSCPDVCPTTLLAAHNALASLGPEARRALVIFVTVDPDRDDAAKLAEFVAYFDPRISTISGAQVPKVLSAFRARAARGPTDKDGAYTVDHTAIIYVLDSGQRVLDAIPETLPAKELTDRLTNALRVNAANTGTR